MTSKVIGVQLGGNCDDQVGGVASKNLLVFFIVTLFVLVQAYLIICLGFLTRPNPKTIWLGPKNNKNPKN